MNLRNMQEFSTPMMQQYMQIRQQHADCMLFFRLGDFYELFLDDAVEGAKILGITLTRRPRGKDGDIPMAGVPFHSANSYINKLLRYGKRIAICEQVSEPDKSGIVDRKVIRIITPGTVFDDTALEQKKHNYTASVSISAEKIGFSVADLLTGDFFVCELNRDDHVEETLGAELLRFAPSECIVSINTYNTPELLRLVTAYHKTSVTFFHEWEKAAKHSEKVLCAHFAVPSSKAFGLSELREGATAAAALIEYLNHTQQAKVTHLNYPSLYSPLHSVLLDPATIENLEIFSTLQDQSIQGSLFSVLDRTMTAMGGRLLRSWIAHPLKNKDTILQRQNVVAELYDKFSQRSEIQEKLYTIFDVQRLSSRLALGLGTSASILNIDKSLKVFLDLVPLVVSLESNKFLNWDKLPVEMCKSTSTDIEKIISDSPELTDGEVGRINDGVDSELDELRNLYYSGKDWIARFEVQERVRTGITSLKCRYNQVFGFYIEISHANLDSVPSDYIRKQTLVNAERFITPELKKHEELILTAETRIAQIERRIFQELVERITAQLTEIKKVAQALAELDVYCSFAQVAQEERYIQPSLNESQKIEIIGGKHPVLASVLKEKFVPNDVHLDADQQLLIITGPNMAGKSVFMRQVAIIVLLAHIGSFVPAESANIAVVDRIFVRSGASDNISKGLSTFMVEMVEAAYILHQATNSSLVIMDEIGRGTSTYDGISIAWAIAEYLVTEKNKQPKILFATHYHELQALAEKFPQKIKNYQMIVEEHNNRPVFLHSVGPGAASHSFGIEVAQIAGLPERIIERAKELLKNLENDHRKENSKKAKLINTNESEKSNEFSKLLGDLIGININTLTPLESLQLLATIQKRLQKIKHDL